MTFSFVPGLEGEGEALVVGQQALALDDLLDDAAQVDGVVGDGDHLLVEAGEFEELGDEGLEPLRGLVQHAEQALAALDVLEDGAVAQQGDGGGHGGERRAQLVDHVAEEALPLALQPAQLGDVAHDDQAGRSALPIAEPHAHAHLAHRAVRVDDLRVVFLGGLLAVGARVVESQVALLHALVEDAAVGVAEQVPARVSEHVLEGVVDELDARVLHDDQAAEHVVHQPAEPQLAAALLLLRAEQLPEQPAGLARDDGRAGRAHLVERAGQRGVTRGVHDQVRLQPL